MLSSEPDLDKPCKTFDISPKCAAIGSLSFTNTPKLNQNLSQNTSARLKASFIRGGSLNDHLKRLKESQSKAPVLIMKDISESTVFSSQARPQKEFNSLNASAILCQTSREGSKTATSPVNRASMTSWVPQNLDRSIDFVALRDKLKNVARMQS